MRNALASLLRTSPRPARRGLVWSAAIVSVLTLALLAAGTLPTFLGYDSFVVVGGSMAPAMREHSILVARRVDPRTIRPGDVITFRRPQNPDLPVTHRVVSVRMVDDIPIFRTKGDANAGIDPEEVSGALPVSQMVYSVPLVGFVVGFAQTLAGKIVLIALPLMLLVGLWLQSVRVRLQQRERSAEPASLPIAMAPAEQVWEALRPAVGAENLVRFVPGRGRAPSGPAPLGAVREFAVDPPGGAGRAQALTLAAGARLHLDRRLVAALWFSAVGVAIAMSTLIAATLLVKTSDDRPADSGVAAAPALPAPESLPSLPAALDPPSAPRFVEFSMILRAARQGAEETALRAAAASRAVAPAFDFVGFGPVSSQPHADAQEVSATLAAVVSPDATATIAAAAASRAVGDVGAIWVGVQAVVEAQRRAVADWLATLRGWPAVMRWTVGPGHTLEAIAQEARTTVAAIVALNGLPDPNHIYVGQRLTVPLDFALPAPAPANAVAPFFAEP